MSLSEFELIERYFNSAFSQGLSPGISLGIGDDAAVISPSAGQQGCICTDVLVADVHFPTAADPADIAQRALRVNLSDLAAMGATPVCFTLGLTLPAADENWLSRFAAGLLAASNRFDCPLVGGDTTRGPLNIAITVYGEVPVDEALRRSGAREGDSVFVTGNLGKGRTALEALRLGKGGDNIDEIGATKGIKRSDMTPSQKDFLHQCFYQPEPRLAFAAAARQYINSAIDVSDGLYADLGHLARASGQAMYVDAAALPFAEAVIALTDSVQRQSAALFGGDDYEICFTAAGDSAPALEVIAAESDVVITCIGEVAAGTGVTVLDDGNIVSIEGNHGFEHFGGAEK
jgi:thiamine-monophosphate kinase